MPQIRVIDDFTSFLQEEEPTPFPAMNDVGNSALFSDNAVNAALFSGTGGNVSFSSNYSAQFIPNPPSSVSGLGGAPPFQPPEVNVNAEDTLPGLVSGGEDEVSDDMEEMRGVYRQPDKKRRLTVDQVRRLETNFDVDNRLEPQRKTRLAKELGLEPKQVAIWFQNRRARFKSKRLEKEFYTLRASYDSIKAGFDTLMKENERLRNQLSKKADELTKLRETLKSNSGLMNGSMNGSMGSVHLERFGLGRTVENMVMAGFGQGDGGLTGSGVFDYEIPRSVDWNKQVVGQGMAPEGNEDPLVGFGVPPMTSEFGFLQLEGDVFGSAFGESSDFVLPEMDDQFAYWPSGLGF